MKRLGWGLLFAVAGFLSAAFASYFLVLALSPNTHDKSLEAAMTSVFFFGPIGAVTGFIVGLVRGGRRQSP